MRFTDQLWKQTLPVFEAITKHPFITEMCEGTLDKKRFLFYMEQDAHYLVAFSKALAQIAARSSDAEDIELFLQFAADALIAERELHTKFLGNSTAKTDLSLYSNNLENRDLDIAKASSLTDCKSLNISNIKGLTIDRSRELSPGSNTDFPSCLGITPANLSYTHFLLATVKLKPLHEAMAAVLPCFWIYREVGQSMIQKATPHNPYEEWLLTYSGEEFAKQTEKVIDLVEKMALRASLHDREMMHRAFFRSTVFEWHFWNDAYHMTLFEESFVHSKSLFCHEPILVGPNNINFNR